MTKGSKDTRLANDLWRFAHFDRFENGTLSCRTVKRGREGCHFLPVLTLLIRNPEETRGLSQPRRGPERAGQDLEGGLRSTLEGFEHSGHPCAQVLSVAGFYASLGLFLLGRTVYSEVKRDPFVRETPTRVDERELTAGHTERWDG